MVVWVKKVIKNPLFAWLIVLPFLLWACAKQFDTIVSKSERSFSVLKKNLDGVNLKTIDGESLSLPFQDNKVTLLIFGKIFCASCNQQIKEFVDSLHNSYQNPTEIHIVSILLVGPLDQAQLWRATFSIPWEVAIDKNGSYLRQFCSINTVPCLVVYDPAKGVVFRRNGVVSLSELLSYTGNWEQH